MLLRLRSRKLSSSPSRPGGHTINPNNSKFNAQHLTYRVIYLPIAALLAAALTEAAFSHIRSFPLSNMNFECGSDGDPPPGWYGTMGASASIYSAVIDREFPKSGKASARLERVAAKASPDAFGVLFKTINAESYRGKRLRLTAAVRLRGKLDSKGGLWLRVDAANGPLRFAQAPKLEPTGDAKWVDQTIELAVPKEANTLAFGLLLAGPGEAWIDNVRMATLGLNGEQASVVSAWPDRCPSPSASFRSAEGAASTSGPSAM